MSEQCLVVASLEHFLVFQKLAELSVTVVSWFLEVRKRLLKVSVLALNNVCFLFRLSLNLPTNTACIFKLSTVTAK